MGQDRPTQLDPLERASPQHWTMDRVQNKPYSSVQHTQSSESFKGKYGVTSQKTFPCVVAAARTSNPTQIKGAWKEVIQDRICRL
jgi:hypothetical protein